MKGILKSGILLLVAAGVLGGCAEERDPIDRVQPYALPKTFFIGEDFNSVDDDPEFWTQNTMIDVGYGASQSGLFTSTYAQPMSRVKFQITEDYLIARAAYERITGSDGKGTATGDETQDGEIVAVFAIQSHFDIVNSYNPTTGEKLNVIEENTYDRPWYEREYIRVNWAKNLNTDSYSYDTLSMVGLYGGISYTPLSYYVEDPDDEDAPVFDIENGYMDVTTKAQATPGLIDLSHLGWGIDSFPACMLESDFFGGTAPVGTCEPVELTLRHSFRKVDDNIDYQPIDYDGWRFQAYGGFAWTERRGYARNYGMLDEDHHKFLSRLDIWERHHYYEDPENMEGPVECYTPDTWTEGTDPNVDADGNGTADACEAVTAATGFGGSQCDEFEQKCTQPFRARTPVKMPWYYTNNSQQIYYEASEIATHQWDAALRTAIASSRYAECMATECDLANDDIASCQTACARDWPMYFGQQRDNDDMLALSMEVDDCRHGLTHDECQVDDADDKEACCIALADEVGNKRGVASAVKDLSKMSEVLVLCHSPVQADDPDVCAPDEERLPADVLASDCQTARANGDEDLMEICAAARNVRRGDLRYHLVNVIEEPQTPSPWGIMTAAIDPLNGYTVQSCVNVWAWVNTYWGQRLVDYMRFAAGEIAADEVTEAEYIKDWTDAANVAGRSGVAGTMTATEYNKRIGGFLGEDVTKIGASRTQILEDRANAIDPDIRESIKKVAKEFTGVMADAELGTTTGPIYNARLAALSGTEVEASLMNEQMQEYYGVDGMTLSDDVMNMASPLRGGNIAVRRELDRMKQAAFAKQGMCELEMAATPVSINGLSGILQEKFGQFSHEDSTAQQLERSEKMVDYIARRVHMAVIVHEMGHAMAHRHNFVSSSDAWNFRPQYWQLRTKNNTVTLGANNRLTSMLDETGETTIGPRYFDPVTDNEEDNLIWMWQHSSVMDYAGEATQDFLGLGAYDFASLRMFYGDTVPVLPAEYASLTGSTAAASRAQGIMAKLDNFGGIVGFQYDYGGTTVHYSNLNYYYNLLQDCEPVEIDDFVPARYDADRDGPWHPVLDGEIVSVDGGDTYTRCHQQKVDYIPWRTLRAPTDAEYEVAGYMRSAAEVNGKMYGSVFDAAGRIRAPYGFATDRWADIGNAAVYRHDNGADTYEIFNFMMTQQELFHIFDNYRRGRSTFSVSGASGRINGRYNGKIRDGAKGLALQRNFYKNYSMQLGVAADQLWDYAAETWFPDPIIASTMAFDHFVRTAQRPQIGPHAVESDFVNGTILRSQTDAAAYEADPTALNVPNGAYGTEGGFDTFNPGGKLVENQLDPTMGEYESEYTINAGSYYDKAWAAMMMTESVDNFISDSRGDFVDKRYRATSLADLMPDGYRRWIANNLTNDEFLKGAHIAVDTSGDPEVDSSTLYPTGTIGNTLWWSDPPQACFAQEGTNICASYANSFDMNENPTDIMPIESQMGWETQKFLITMTNIYLPENDQQWWMDMMAVYDISLVDDISLSNPIELHYPDGRSYVATRYGRETIFGKEVEKGIGARVIEYANELLHAAYETTDVDYDGDGDVDWYEVVINEDNEPVVLYDSNVTGISSVNPATDCTPTDNSGCTCDMNQACMQLEEYMTILEWMNFFTDFREKDDYMDGFTGIWS